jgi:hypothetical protein
MAVSTMKFLKKALFFFFVISNRNRGYVTTYITLQRVQCSVYGKNRRPLLWGFKREKKDAILLCSAIQNIFFLSYNFCFLHFLFSFKFLTKNMIVKYTKYPRYRLSKTILLLCLSSYKTKKHAPFQHNFLRKTENSPDTCFMLKVIQNKLII